MSSYVRELQQKIASWKQAKLEMGNASFPEHLAASTVGRLGVLRHLLFFLTTDFFRSPRKSLKRIKEHEDTAKLLESVRPEQLGDVKVRLGGTHLVDDMKRVFTNKRTGPIGKALGAWSVPLAALSTAITRGPHYNPWSNTVVQPVHNTAITEHELGHAIDFNNFKKNDKERFLKRQLKNTKRDLYGMAYAIPFANLWHEAQANRQSGKALEEALKNNPDELERRRIARLRVLPAAYSTYVTGNVDPTGVSTMPTLVGMRIASVLMANKRKKALESKRDGDGDGKINDGTKNETVVKKSSDLYRQFLASRNRLVRYFFV